MFRDQCCHVENKEKMSKIEISENKDKLKNRPRRPDHQTWSKSSQYFESIFKDN